MKDNLQQRALRKIIGALVESDAFTVPELTRLSTIINEEPFTVALSAILRDVAGRLGPTFDDPKKGDRRLLDPVMMEIADIIARRRMSKHEFIDHVSYIYPPAREILKNNRILMSEILQELANRIPESAKIALLQKLNISRPVTDEYLHGIMRRDKGQR